MRCVLAFLPLALAACATGGGGDGASAGPDPSIPDGGGAPRPGPDHVAPAKAGAESGTRLKVRWLRAEDGSKIANGLHDAERGEDCAFGRAADGATRCLPTAGFAGSYYGDAACRDLLGYALKGCAPPRYAGEPVATAAGCASQGGVRVRKVKGRFVGTQIYVRSSTGTCSATPASAMESSYDLYVLGEEIPATSFVAATETTE